MFHRTFPGPVVEMNSVNNDDVEISVDANNVGRVHFKKLFMDLSMRYHGSESVHWINYDICVPEDICRRSTGQLGSCIENQGTIEPGVGDRK